MPIEIVQNDITTMKVDAIVNAARPSLLGGGGVDGAIHAAAGPGLLAECRTLGGCRTGEAKITGGHELPCRYVIHTVGPVWEGGNSGEEALLASCYRASLELAQEKDCQTVAFPLISAGAYGYPKDQALRVAMESIRAFLAEHEMTVYLVLRSRSSFVLSRRQLSGVESYINEVYTGLPGEDRLRKKQISNTSVYCMEPAVPDGETVFGSRESEPDHDVCVTPIESPGAMDFTLDESFQQMLLRKIDERGMTDVACYKRANIDRRLFSRIRSDPEYQPSKRTAVAFAVALELDLSETKELLEKAGFALSRSNLFDVIIEYFISRRRYDVFEINEVLFAKDQVTLG